MKHKLLIFAILAIVSANSYAQYSVNMSNGQTLPIDGCLHPTGTIYDDGGPNGSYSNNFDGYVVITVPSGITINITGSYDLEGCCDYITIWDGDANGTQLWNNHSSGTLTLSATSGTMTIRFHSDYSVNPSGFALSYTCSGVGQNCINAPNGVTLSNITTSTAQVDWNATNTSGPFMVNLNGNISTLNTNTLSLTGLNANTHYDLAISSVSDNWAPCCTARESFRTACGTMNPPMEESFDDYGIGYNILPTCWTKLLNYDDTLNEPQIVGNPYSSSPGALRMYCGSNNDGNHYSMAIAPRMNVTDTATVSVVNLSDAIYLPNVFTPDKPTNNTFYAVGKGIVEFEIWIYDRRGDLMYHSTDINEHWNGTHNGLICHQGTYVYRCRYTTMQVPNGWQTLTGTVTILK